MGKSITGQWARSRAFAYSASPAKWGTGINPIHAFYGSEPLRTYGREGVRNYPDVHAPATAPADFVQPEHGVGAWGYDKEDIGGLDVYQLDTETENWAGITFIQDGWPSWDMTTPEIRATTDVREIYPVGSPGIVANAVRTLRFGPRDTDSEVSNEVPTETVSEGWLNKPASGGLVGGDPPDAIPSDDSQIFVQTSMIQRYKVQNNGRSQLRGTDDDRTPISSRIAPMKLKVYSGDERHYDMFPYQIEQMPKPFWYRQAATGRIPEMLPNRQYIIEPIQRTPPPDPSLGNEDVSFTEPDNGYTPEDMGWY